MNRPAEAFGEFDELPVEMIQAQRWLVWKAIPQPEGKKPRKVPFYPDGTERRGTLDSPEDQSRFGTFTDACKALENGTYTGLGFALGPDGTGAHWQGVDLDDVKARPGLVTLMEVAPGYVERSPSGNGFHSIGYGQPFASLGSNTTGIEAYAGGRYFTVTGDAIGGRIEDLSRFVVETLRPVHKPRVEPQNETPHTAGPEPDDLIRDLRSALWHLDADDYASWISTGLALKTLGAQGRALWLEWSSTSPKFDAADAARRWGGFEPNSTDYRAIFAEAQRSGWTNPKKRDRSEVTPRDAGRENPAKNTRPTIVVYNGSFKQNTEQTIQALAQLTPPCAFQRGSMLARVAHLPEPTDVQGVIVPKGTATLIELNSVSMRLEMADAAIWKVEKTAKDGKSKILVDCNPPGEVANAVIASAGKWGAIPVLAAVTEAPILRPDGSIHDVAGYDPKTRLYFDGRAPKLAIPANPDRDDALRACAYLLRPFSEFPFAEPVREQSVVLAYLFTLAQRQLLALAPLFCVSATAPGTGKGLLIEACNLIVRGRDAAIMPPPGGQDAEAETRKRITALMVQGVSSVLLDNWTTAIGGDSMNMLLTSESWTDRVLGQSKTVTLPARVTWSATGNNLTVRGDMVRRTVLAVIDAATERPEQREFKVRNLQSHVLEHRADLLGALFTILRAYRLAGEPERDGPTLGRFEPWSRSVAAPIRWLGFPDPTESQDRLRADDPEIQKLGALLCGWADVFGNRAVTIADIIDVVTGDFPPNGATGPARFALKEALEDVAGDRPGQINRRKLGWYLRHFSGRVCDGLRLTVDGSRKDRAKYIVAKAA